MKKFNMILLTLVLFLVFIATMITLVYANTLWYNGDYDGYAGGSMPLHNEWNVGDQYRRVFDDFDVPAEGWIIHSVWSNNFMNFSASNAIWEIRQEMDSGSPGCAKR